MNALRTRASWAASAWVAAAHAAGASVIISDQARPALQALADHVHEYAVLVTAGADETGVSGVLIGDGLVLTELRAVVSQDLRGVAVKEDIRVVAAGARVAARMIAAAPDADVAVLQLAAGAGVLIPAEALRRLIARVHSHPRPGFNPG